MIVKENINSPIKTMSENIDLQKSLKELYSPILQQAVNDLKSVSLALPEITSPFFQAMQDLGKKATNLINEIKKIQITIPEETKQLFRHATFVIAASDKKWPVFLIEDECFESKALTVFASNDNDKIINLISSHCNNNFWEERIKSWGESSAINSLRLPLLSEAVAAHNNNMYFSSVSICMCQLYGIAADIQEKIKSHKLSLSSELVESIATHFGMEYKYMNKEKGLLLQSYYYTEGGWFLWDVVLTYIKEEILCSPSRTEQWNQPLRNKICHGEQLNYGTLEHSLKSLLCIDMLIHLANSVEFAVNNYEEELS